MNTCLVIDGNSIINRAFYGVKALSTKSGKPTNAIYGMVNIISRQLEAIKPTYAAVAFDLKAPTFRHKMYDEYKAGRKPTPPELLSQFDDAKKILTAMGLHVLALEGYEADDIQGTVAKMAAKLPDTHAYILSGDRDLFQLIEPNITVLYAGNHDTVPMTPEAFQEKYDGVTVPQFVDLKALMGDSSDHIPGVAGVGEKTAIKLITQFGSLDGIYENIESSDIAKGVREKLKTHKEDAYLSQALARIKTDVPLGLQMENLRTKAPDNQTLLALFTELELNSFIVRFQLTHQPKTQEVVCGRCEYTPKGVNCLETLDDKFAFYYMDGTAYLADKTHHFSVEAPLKALESLFSKGKTLICYDGKRAFHEARAAGIQPQCVFADIALYAYVINSADGTAPLSQLAEQYLFKSLEADAPAAHLLFEMESTLSKKVKELGCDFLLYDVELPLLPVLGEMEENGFRIHKEGLADYGEKLRERAKQCEQAVFDAVGKTFNLNSPKQLGEVLFEDLKLPSPRKKKTGSYATDVDTLQKLRSHHPIIEEILLYRHLTKLHSTYIIGLLNALSEDGRIHTDFKQSLTATGRLSSAEPNLQNIPIRTPLGRQIRHYFIPSPGHVLVDADYSQIELRLLAVLSDDRVMREAFLSGEDIHTATASSAFGIPKEQVTPELRKRAKAVNFGIVYGISAHSLSEDLGISNREAKAYIESYKETYPAIASYLDTTVSNAEENGYTKTLWGRRRYIPELKAPNGIVRAFGKRMAMNAPLQGTAADIMKLATVKVFHALKEELPEAKLLMQVHDELVLECPPEVAEKAAAILKREMEAVAALSVPLSVETVIGDDWMK